MDVRRRVASLVALGGAIGALAIELLYVNLIIQQGAVMPGSRVPLIIGWIAACVLLAGIGAFTPAPARRVWLLGWSAAAMLALSVPAVFSIGIPLLLCAIAIGVGALRAAELLETSKWVAFLAPIVMIAVAGGALLVGFVLTAP
ncbi:MAG: hypothetical protein ABI458_03445 [Chloroflexota bacterium]